MKLFKNFVREEEGQDAIEYALLVGFVALAIVGGMTTLATAISAFYTGAGAALPAA